MGSSHTNSQVQQFNRSWRPSQSVDHLTIWENRDNPSYQLQQYIVSKSDSNISGKLLSLRNRNPFIVNAFSLEPQSEDSSFCGTDNTTKKIFVERIPLRLTNVNDIPFPDVLHIYDSSLNGFGQLSSLAGFFTVDQDQIGINEQGHVKVWLNTAFQIDRPVARTTQGEMIGMILQVINSSTDQESFPPSVPNPLQYIGTDRNSTFQSVKEKLKSYASQYSNSAIPSNLNCYHKAGGHQYINNWCRNNRSYGFQQSSMRLSEKIYQTSRPNFPVRVNQVRQQSFVSQPKQSLSQPKQPYFPAQNNKQMLQNRESKSLAVQPRVHEQRSVITSPQYLTQEPLKTSQIQNQNQVNRYQPQLIISQRILSPPPISFQQTRQIYKPNIQTYKEVESNKRIIGHQNLDRTQANQRISQVPQRIMQQIVSQPPQVQTLGQKPYQQQQQQQQVKILTQKPPQIISQPAQIQVLTQKPQQQLQTIVVKPKIQPVKFMTNNTPVTGISIQNLPQTRNQYPIKNQQIAFNQQQFQPLGTEPSSYKSITIHSQKNSQSDLRSNREQNDSRLQQQRVISQTIEIKQNVVANSEKELQSQVTNSYSHYKPSQEKVYIPEQSYTDTYDWKKYTKTETPQQTTFMKGNQNSNRFTETEDGKSSPQFLALMKQLKGMGGNGENGSFNEVYSLVQDTPVSTFKQKKQDSSKRQAIQPYDTYSHQTYSFNNQEYSKVVTKQSYEHNQGYKFETETKQYGQYDYSKVAAKQANEPNQDYKFEPAKQYGQYDYSKYVREIDPELEADLNSFKQ